MAVKIRLSRFGKKKQPHYRMVVIDQRKAREGRFLENVGIYTPRGKTRELWVDLDKVAGWQKKGAICSATVNKLVKQYQRNKDAGTATAKPE